MTLAEIIGNPGQWLHASGPEGKIVFSSRVRLARNLRERPFPGWAKKAERVEVLRCTKAAVESLDIMDNSFSENLEAMSTLDRQMLVERHLISREHAAKGVGSAVVISADQSLSVMINEEDHLRMQAIRAGLQLQSVYEMIDTADSLLEEKLDYAFHPVLGYLTACPTNVGTGMRASAMLHLPALVMGDQINKIINSVNKIGLAVRGLHGEGSEAMGNLFQVSNQTTLGESEAEIIGRLERVIAQIIEHEQNARALLLQHKPVTLLDQIGRAYGILSHAHSISSKEGLNLLSLIKLGIDLGFFPESGRQDVDGLFVESQPAHLQRGASLQKMSAEARDTLRAALIRAKLKNIPAPEITRIATPETAPSKETHDE
ncbi:MAG: protein arginine kinase [Terrimicrobiaceae bacterium]